MNLSADHPVLLVLVPLAFSALCPVVSILRRKFVFPWALAGVGGTSFLAWSLIGKVTPTRPVTYNVSGWPPPWGIQIRIDFTGLWMICIITGICLLLTVYSLRYVEHELKPERLTYYYTLFLLIFTAMIGFCITGDLFNLFVFMEIFSITSYALVAISGEKKSIRAALKYLLMGATSSLLVLLSIAFLYSLTGNLNMLEISRTLARTPMKYIPVAAVALVLFIVGFAVKSALFPLHIWLPEAHSIAPSPISAMLSALVIKMGVFGILRLLFTVYGPGFARQSASWHNITVILTWAGAVSIVAGSSMAIIQRNLKVMIAYSSVAYIGYIILGINLLNNQGTTGGLFYILAHAMGKSCFFLVAGCFIYLHGARYISDLRGLGRTMPVTAGAFALTSMSIVGLPPTAGFMGKWYILWGCFRKGGYALVVLALIGSLLSAVYCFRVVYYLFFTGPREEAVPLREAPASMYTPAAVLACGTLFFGIFSGLVMPSLTNAARVILTR